MDMLDTSKVEFSNKDMKDKIILPSKLDDKLSHFLGIHMGDGCLSRQNKGYRLCYDGHYINEFDWYYTYLSKLIKSIFNKDVVPIKGHNSIRISFDSKAIHSFLNKVCGLPAGPKDKCAVPEMIMKAAPSIQKAFLRGMADTDISLVFKNRHKNINYYPVIDYQTCNKELQSSLIRILQSMGFKVYFNSRMKKRKNRYYLSHYFQINGLEAFNKWNSEIGFTSYNQLTKIKVWKKFGFLPSNTTIKDRLDFLECKKDIFYFNKQKDKNALAQT